MSELFQSENNILEYYCFSFYINWIIINYCRVIIIVQSIRQLLSAFAISMHVCEGSKKKLKKLTKIQFQKFVAKTMFLLLC